MKQMKTEDEYGCIEEVVYMSKIKVYELAKEA